MDRAHGPLPGWWPAESGYEVLVGALLIQQSRWQQVERSLARLRAETGLQPHAIASAPEGALAEWIRPSGFNRQKVVRLRALSHWWSQSGGEDGLGDVATPQLRDALLAQPGIGPETADAILLYAFGRPVFVVDAYLKRLLARTGLGAAATGTRGRAAHLRPPATRAGMSSTALPSPQTALWHAFQAVSCACPAALRSPGRDVRWSCLQPSRLRSGFRN